MSWRLSGNLKVAAADVKKHFGKVTIYSVGDLSHKARKSDHNPDGRGVVCAIDVMFSVGSKASAVVKAFKGRGDIAYIIHNRTIWTKASGWKARRYTGSDPHTNHVHISSLHTAVADKTRTHLVFSAAAQKPAAASKPTLRVGAKGTAVGTLQGKLKAHGYALKVDKDFGAATLAAVKNFQHKSNLTPDGVVGSKTWARLG